MPPVCRSYGSCKTQILRVQAAQHEVYIPQTIITTPNTEPIDTLCLSTWDLARNSIPALFGGAATTLPFGLHGDLRLPGGFK